MNTNLLKVWENEILENKIVLFNIFNFIRGDTASTIVIHILSRWYNK